MFKKLTFTAFLPCALICLLATGCSKEDDSMMGTWVLDQEQSTDLAPWRYRTLTLEIRENGERVVLLHKWRRGNEPFFVDSLSFVPGEGDTQIPIATAHWPENWFMGVLAIPGTVKTVSGDWQDGGKLLVVEQRQPVQISQGEAILATTREFRREGDQLIVVEKRESRPTAIRLVFQRPQEAS